MPMRVKFRKTLHTIRSRQQDKGVVRWIRNGCTSDCRVW